MINKYSTKRNCLCLSVYYFTDNLLEIFIFQFSLIHPKILIEKNLLININIIAFKNIRENKFYSLFFFFFRYNKISF